jgi:predicted RNase H-like HicB family nuclease
MVRYHAAIVDGEPGNHGVVFPDLAGCTSADDTLEDDAIHAGHVAVMARHGEAIPLPSQVESLPPPEPGEVVRLLTHVDLPVEASEAA